MTDRQQKIKQVALIGGLINVTLGIAKIFFGWLGHSQALIADGIHSLSDISTDFLVYFASHYGGLEADQEHPYGHRRIETAATFILSFIVVLAGLGIAWDSAQHLFYHQLSKPTAIVLVVALASIVANEGLFHYIRLVANKIDSNLLHANAWHHRSDALSSIIVFIGVLGSLVGFPYLDAVAAILVAVMVVKMGLRLAFSSVRELIDTGVDSQTLDEIKRTIRKTSGVVDIHQLRTRQMAGKILIDVHILVNERLSVSEGHHIADRVYHSLSERIRNIYDVTIHIDPEDDEVCSPSLQLPPRERLVEQIDSHWRHLAGYDDIADLTLHYLDGELHIELRLPLSVLKHHQADALEREYRETAGQIAGLASVKIHFFNP